MSDQVDRRQVELASIPEVRLIPVPGPVPEDVAVDREGWLVTALRDSGQLLRVHPETGEIRELARLDGQPLGVEIFPDGDILVCNADRGLERVDPRTGKARVLLDRVAGRPLRLCNNAAIASDGTIYVSESSQAYPLARHRRDLIEDTATGRLIRLDANGAAEVLLDGLRFANGVALVPDESCVLVAETGACRIQRVWLAGPERGRIDVFRDRLPGMPDNLSTGTDGLVWVAIPAPRHAGLEALHRLPRAIRRAVAVVADWIDPALPPYFAVMALDVRGEIVHAFRGDPRIYRAVTGVREHHGRVYLGTIAIAAIATFDRRERPRSPQSGSQSPLVPLDE